MIPSLSELPATQQENLKITIDALPGIDLGSINVDAIASNATSITTSTPMPNVSYSSEPTAFLSQGGGGGYSGGGYGISSCRLGVGTAFSMAGIAGDAAGMSNSTFRLTNGAYNGSQFSPHYYPTGWNGGSVARITTYSVSKMGGYVSFGAGAAGTGLAYYQLANGTGSTMTLPDALVGSAGLINTISPYFGGVEIPVVGHCVAFYGWIRFWGDLGYDHPVSTWFIDNDFKSIIIR